MKYAGDYKQLHAEGKFPGTTVLVYKERIANIFKHHGIKTILDYGCGKAAAYFHNHIDDDWNVDATLYDPFFEQCNILDKSKKHDAVLCIDVVEHVPEEELNETLTELFSLASRVAVITFCNRPAKKELPSGGNAHVTLHDRAWWETKLDSLCPANIVYYLFENK